MPLSTRRRISPRTKRRYRAIRNFFRRTLGSIASQPDIKINSSIAVNVTDLKRKIGGIEHQLDEVSKHCQDIVSFENISRKEIESLIPTEGNDINSFKVQNYCPDKKFTETELLYKTSKSHFIKAENRDSGNCLYDEPSNKDQRSSDMSMMNHEKYDANNFVHKTKSKKSRRDIYDDKCGASRGNLRKNRTQPNLENLSWYGSHVSLGERGAGGAECPGPAPMREDPRRSHRGAERARCPVPEEVTTKTHKDQIKRHKSESPTRHQERRAKSKNSNISYELDQDFIADLIQRQYKPVKMFDRRSDCSQISFPVCRDNEFSKPDDLIDGSDMCSCCVAGRSTARPRRTRRPALVDMRSLCDTRLYSARRRKHSHPRHQPADAYNDSNLYDVVPVKEKSSPKSRRKFIEDNMRYEYLEVPPSPRSNRPRLNLQAQQYDESDENRRPRTRHQRRNRSPYRQRRPECVDSFRSEVSSDETTRLKATDIKPKPTKNAEVQEDMGTPSYLQYTEVGNDKTNSTFNDTLNKSDSNNDKTDKALSEIKDILQSFLQEIKKEASTSQCDRASESKTDGKCEEDIHQNISKTTPNVSQNSGHNEVAGYGLGVCGLPGAPGASILPGCPPPYLTNPCCYRMMPVCPVNCVQNGYLVGSPSCTQCEACMSGYNEPDKQTSNPKEVNETDNLIREIYKYVALNPNMRKSESSENRWREFRDAKKLQSRGVGKSPFPSKHDAGVCTLPPKCYSKSCEAISARAPMDVHSRTNASVSDTVLERMSYDATTQSSSTYDTTTTNESSSLNKGKKSKFASVLQSFGLLKKNKKTNKKDVIEEESETESSTEVNEKRKPEHPYRQDLTNYMMHTQEFYHPPPGPLPRRDRHSSPPRGYGYPPHDYRMREPMSERYDPYRDHMRAHASAPPYGMRPQASAPPYPCPCDPHCHHNMPQVPLCLKEIEVKSTGTQSERRLPFFRKFSQRRPLPTSSSSRPSREARLKTYGTQTIQSKPGLFKSFQSKGAGKGFNFEPFAFNYKEQKKLAQGDNKMKNAMLKKLFYKRNPFSPRNLIVRTLMGNDRSSWGVPPPGMAMRPRMFL